jgi:hypothetical protein
MDETGVVADAALPAEAGPADRFSDLSQYTCPLFVPERTNQVLRFGPFDPVFFF